MIMDFGNFFCSIIPILDFCILDGKMVFIFDMLENGLMN